jgi:hypothetical protein
VTSTNDYAASYDVRNAQQPSPMAWRRYSPFTPVDLPDRTWPTRTITKAPRWAAVDLRDGVINGPAIGTTIEGYIDTMYDRVNMTGTFVPVYGLNNMFAKIPVLGMLLGGGANEGLFGLNFRISGPATAPVLSINPLSALAPGFLRKIFGAGEMGTSQMPQAETPPATDKDQPMQFAPSRGLLGPFR